ncbi:RNA polymerase II, Rpb4, core protein [Prunus dulcis]|uniref:DNA-directed RNA polymerase III subunit RPC9 n=1 Tax=Prunus dulcis TaxID=3755 RepID=A0A4Y1QKJ3_PRUDU|nr:RNA polymerase II, Rpb4, core protein [Prunus dulcis]
MKIVQANSSVLTNFDVLKFLESRGASEDSARVYGYLFGTPARGQTTEKINEFKEKCKKYDLAEAEVLNIINTRPSSIVGIYPLIENCDLRLGDTVEELVELVVEVFPSPLPAKTVENDAKTTNVDQNDNDEGKPENEEEMETIDGS